MVVLVNYKLRRPTAWIRAWSFYFKCIPSRLIAGTRRIGGMASICKSLGTNLSQKSFPVFVLMGCPCSWNDSTYILTALYHASKTYLTYYTFLRATLVALVCTNSWVFAITITVPRKNDNAQASKQETFPSPSVFVCARWHNARKILINLN